jgi:hypothetical protein
MKKKLICTGFAILCLLVVLTGCASFKVESMKDVQGTPEDSVLVYGVLANTNRIYFSQMNPERPADFQQAETSGGYFFLKPVSPGSRYAVTYFDISKRKGSVEYYYQNFLSLQGTFLDFSAPDKPGLYYYGAYDAYESLKTGEKIKLGNKAKERKAQIYCLKSILPAYQGTEWEAVIQKTIMELKNEK